ncbi:acyl-CoA dehydrogenase [Myxococcota bacterium]|nr:acyl-CoA dehydrogenase [Myxococcota bacterium]
MGIAITEEHQELARVVRAFLAENESLGANRALLEAEEEGLPSFWKPMAELGWTGLHLPEAYGGQGFGLEELVVVLEEMGHAVAPGPFLPTVLASTVIATAGSDAQKRDLLPGLADGSVVGAVGLDGALSRNADGNVEGSAGLVLGGGLANLLVLPLGDDLIVVEREQSGVAVEARKNIDPSRRVAEVTCSDVRVEADRVLSGARATALRLGRSLAAAEASGGAHACTEMASEYAKVRKQFGRTIGTFQAVKHHCANMIVDAEQATAAAWDAARAEGDDLQAELASCVAASIALPAFAQCAQVSVQVHGGLGFTWEHDAHLYVRRSGSLSAIFGPVGAAQAEVTRLADAGVRREFTLELPPEAEAIRVEVREFVESYKNLPEDQKRKALSDSGYLMPHWPKPWGREADAVEQLVIDQEFEGVGRTNLGISGWNTLTIAQHGTKEQVERWVRPSMEGEIEFCQLFSEPNAGSDAAGVQTRGIKVDGGWLVTGQKVWTSNAHNCNRGFATVRTDPDASKHAGISMMVVNMEDDAVDIRPLRQVTGHSDFNEVFFNEYFVPDDDVVGPVNQGWVVARSTLGNERVSIGGGGYGMGGGHGLLDLRALHAPEDPGVARELGALISREQVMRLLNLRRAARAVIGAEPGPEGNVTKLLGSENIQRSAALGAQLAGSGAALVEGREGIAAISLLAARAGSIAGGTSEIVRNQIAERILDLPRDPLLK